VMTAHGCARATRSSLSSASRRSGSSAMCTDSTATTVKRRTDVLDEREPRLATACRYVRFFAGTAPSGNAHLDEAITIRIDWRHVAQRPRVSVDGVSSAVPSQRHETLLLLFRNRPELAPELLRDPLDARPVHAQPVNCNRCAAWRPDTHQPHEYARAPSSATPAARHERFACQFARWSRWWHSLCRVRE
jgi:hypothetical protein